MTVKRLLNTLDEERTFWQKEYLESKDKKWSELAFRAYTERVAAISLIKVLIDEEMKQKREQA